MHTDHYPSSRVLCYCFLVWSYNSSKKKKKKVWSYRAKSQKLFELHELKRKTIGTCSLTLNNKRTKIEREDKKKKKKKKRGVVKTKQKG